LKEETMTKLTPLHLRKPKGKRGGARPGAGPKRTLSNALTPKVYIDEIRHQGFIDLGGGNFSAGVRLAFDLLKEHNLLHPKSRPGSGS
jgi:hypothetical protein